MVPIEGYTWASPEHHQISSDPSQGLESKLFYVDSLIICSIFLDLVDCVLNDLNGQSIYLVKSNQSSV